ncbi:MAG: thioredoxin family protein [Candidatus Heimdallarchaeota archaeon]|nr:thioredoxin family protein [Candidatus Heimdallarchaeota archaeon]
MTVELTDDNFDEYVEKSELLLIDVWAEWCGPCKRSTPVFEKLADKHGDDTKIFAKLDAQNQMNAAKKLKVMSLPTFAIFKNGKLIKKWAGADIGRLRKEIDSVV